MTFREKIDKLLKANTMGINSVNGLERYIGSSTGSIRKYYDLNSEPGLRTIKKIWDNLGVNQTWYETGKGEIFTENSTQVREESVKYEAAATELDVVPVRIVEVKAQAGYMRGYADPEYMETLPVIYVNRDAEHKGRFIAFTISGDSMDDGSRRALCHGDIVLGKELQQHHWKNKLHFNQYLFIIVHEDGVMFKQITGHDVEAGTITCHSFNSQYDDFNLRMEDVKQLFYIKKIVERSIKF